MTQWKREKKTSRKLTPRSDRFGDRRKPLDPGLRRDDEGMSVGMMIDERQDDELMSAGMTS
jgi:hypothetical protein